MRLQDLSPPGSPVARAAYALAASCHTPALLNHVVRSWLVGRGVSPWWRAARASTRRAELLYTAAVLHDLGLVPAYDNATLSYEEAGGHVAVALQRAPAGPPNVGSGPST